ncbi:unnamed protein product, partial [Ectocarpus sp. 12 AP-2014]
TAYTNLNTTGICCHIVPHLEIVRLSHTMHGERHLLTDLVDAGFCFLPWVRGATVGTASNSFIYTHCSFFCCSFFYDELIREHKHVLLISYLSHVLPQPSTRKC